MYQEAATSEKESRPRMKLCLAKEFTEWFKTAPTLLGPHMSSKICIIGIIGKAPLSQTFGKAGPFNEFFEKEVFRTAWSLSGAPKQIEAYFDPGTQTLFLHHTSHHDLVLAGDLFVPNDETAMAFYERLGEAEERMMRELLFIFLLSHAVVLVEPCCRFDTNYIRILRVLNYLREDTIDSVSNLLLKTDGISRTWAANGRMCSPRLLFAFHESPVRHDLGYTKRRELIKKLEMSLEDQIYNLFRKSRVITNDSSLAICALPSNQQFVYVFGPGESVKDPLQDLMETLLTLNPMNLDESLDPDAEPSDKSTEDSTRTPVGPTKSDVSGFFEFLNGHMDLAHGDGFDDNVGKNTPPASFRIPRLSVWIEAAKSLWGLIIESGKGHSDFRYLAPKLNIELRFSDSRCRKVLPLAISTYQDGLPQFYQLHQHEAKLSQALRVLTSQARGPWLEDSIKKLKEDCESYWKSGHEACEILSLTGNHCVHRLHKDLEDKPENEKTDDLAQVPYLSHKSSARYLSTCNCGMRQAYRDDPFDLKEANYLFYEQTDFSCCRKFEKYDFLLFIPPEASESKDTSSVDKDETLKGDDDSSLNTSFPPLPVGPQTQSQGEDQSITGPSTTEGGESFLVDRTDRDNRLVVPQTGSGVLGESTSGKSGEENANKDSDSMPMIRTQEEDEGENVGETGSTADSVGSAIDNLLDDEKYFDREDEEEEDVDTPRMSRRRGATGEREERASSEERVEDEGGKQRMVDPDEHEMEIITKAYQILNMDIERESKAKKAEEKVQTEEESPVSPVDIEERKWRNIEEKWKGHYLEGMPHNQSNPHLMPLFPSWSLLCIGSSSLYSHAHGLRDKQPNFSHGSHYLLPWDVQLKVDLDKWRNQLDLFQQGISSHSLRAQQHRVKKKGTGEGTVTLKVFVGFEYECPRGHRFMLQAPDKMLKHQGPGGPKESGVMLTRMDMPLYFPCSCRSTPPVCGQLSRIHVVTPKAPVIVTLNPKVQPNTSLPIYFHPGTRGLIQMTPAKYYVCRLPYAYVGPNGACYPPKEPVSSGRLLKGSLGLIPDYQ